MELEELLMGIPPEGLLRRFRILQSERDGSFRVNLLARSYSVGLNQ